MYQMPYRDMISLRDARIEHLINEKKEEEDARKKAEQDAIRNKILAK